MTNDKTVFKPIGVIRTEHRSPEETPIQTVYAEGCLGQVEVFPEFAAGLRDLERFSHVFLLYRLHRAVGPELLVRPFLQDTLRGVFATRSPNRPNPLGLSAVRLVRREGRVLHVDGVDMLDGTPLLDIKPYAKRFDCLEDAGDGWLAEVDQDTAERLGRRK